METRLFGIEKEWQSMSVEASKENTEVFKGITSSLPLRNAALSKSSRYIFFLHIFKD